MVSLTMAVDVLMEFLQAALHSVLYLRGLYTKSAFSKSSLYKLPIHVAVHRGLNEYLVRALRSIRPYIENQSLESLSVVISDNNGSVHETVLLQIAAKHVSSLPSSDDSWLIGLEDRLRSILQSMYHSLSQPPLPPEGSTFRLQMSVTGSQTSPSDAEFPMIVTDPPTDSASVVPIQSIHHQLLSVQISLVKNK